MPSAESVGVNVARVVRVKELVVVGRCPGGRRSGSRRRNMVRSSRNHHSEDMRAIERYTLTGPNTLLYEATMTDPKVFIKPWKIGVTLQRHKEAGARIIEDECLEDANGVRHHVSPLSEK